MASSIAAGSAPLLLASLLTLAPLAACRSEGDAARAADAGPEAARAPPLFVEVAAASGIDFVHRNGATGAYNYPELLHAGAAFLDYDNDGWLDAYLVQSGELPGTVEGQGGVGGDTSRGPTRGGSARDSDRLYRNRGDGTFEDVTVTAGIGEEATVTGGVGYGTGIAVGDYDRDGHVDIYITRLGPNVLYRNLGDGRFRDVTAETGVGDPGYSSAATFFDYDADGDLDLYVVNYLDWTPAIERPCFSRGGLRGYCSPLAYGRPQADTLYRNDGDGTFTDVSAHAGIRSVAATGLGVVTADFDGDGRVDLYVANDQMANNLWLNRGDGTFSDEALPRGCALDESGAAQASMGVVTEDLEDDGDWDLFSVNLTGEGAAFHRNLGGGHFQDTTDELRLGAVTQPYTGFGTGFFDFDHDGTLDLFVANGKVRLGDTLEESYAEPNLLLRGTALGTFEDVSNLGGDALALVEVSRGTAFGDYDNDGDVDLLVANNGGPARLLRNETLVRGESAGRHFLSVRLAGSSIDRDGIGAVVVVRTGERTRRRQVQPGYSYGSSNDPRVHFGLGDIDTVDEVTMVWPDGRTETRSGVAADQFLLFEESPPGKRGPVTEAERSMPPRDDAPATGVD